MNPLHANALILAAAQGPLAGEDEADLRAFGLFAALTVGAVFFLVSTALRARALRDHQAQRDAEARGETAAHGETDARRDSAGDNSN